jgi:cell division transport system permease protein
VSRWRGPLLPPGAGLGVGISLLLILLVAAGALASVIGAAEAPPIIHAAAARDGSPTLVVWGAGLESADAAAARAGEILSSVPDVARATPLDASNADAGEAQAVAAPSGAEVRLVAIEPAGADPGLDGRIERTLAAHGPPARLDDHNWHHSPGLRIAAAMAGAAALIDVVVLALLAWLGGAAARRELAASAVAAELVRGLGATDGFLASLVQGRISGQALVASCFGVALAVAAAAIGTRYGHHAVVSLKRLDLAWAALWIPLTAAVALVAARGAAGAKLRAGP